MDGLPRAPDPRGTPGATFRVAAKRDRALRALRARTETWRSGHLLQPVLLLVGGAAAAQAVVFAARPLLTRLYTPEAFGVLTLVTTAATLLSAVAHGGYRFAALLPEQDDDAGGLVGLALIGAVLTTSLVAIAVGVALGAGWTDDGPTWALLPIALLALDGSQTAETWLTRRGRFRTVAGSRMAQAATAVAVQVGAGLAAAGAVGLVGGAAAGFVASLVVAGTAVWRGDGRLLARSFRVASMRALARRYVRFPAFSAPAALLNLTATRLPVFLLAAFAGEAAVGQFGLAYGTLALPLGLVTGGAGQVFFARAAVAVRDGTLPALTRRTLRGLLAVTVFPSLAVVAAGPTLFAVVFGPAWETAGVFARLIAPWVLAASVAAPLTCLFDVLERQRADLAFSVFMASVQTAALVAAGFMGTPVEMVLAASVAGTLLRVAHVAWMLRLASVPAEPVLWDTARSFAAAAPLAAAVWAIDASGIAAAWTVVATAAGGLLTLALAARRDEPPRDEPPG